MSNTILLIEDEEKIAQVVIEYLEAAEYQVSWLDSGEGALEAALAGNIDLLILDVMLPVRSGMEICKDVRQSSDLPIIMLTARVDEIDRLLGLELGADDYVCKPFSPRELVVRVRNLLRRTNSQLQTGPVLTYAAISIDEEGHRCLVGEDEIDLTPVEFRMLAALVRNRGKVLGRSQIISHGYKDNRIVSGRTVDSHIKNLRAKLGVAAEHLHSVYGVGYRIE